MLENHFGEPPEKGGSGSFVWVLGRNQKIGACWGFLEFWGLLGLLELLGFWVFCGFGTCWDLVIGWGVAAGARCSEKRQNMEKLR